jgi:hypothetical protein
VSGICTVHMHACTCMVRAIARACVRVLSRISLSYIIFSEINTGLSIVSLTTFVLFSQSEPRGRAVQPVGSRRPCNMRHRLASSPLPGIHQHQQRARWAFQPPAIGTSRDSACTMSAAGALPGGRPGQRWSARSQQCAPRKCALRRVECM